MNFTNVGLQIFLLQTLEYRAVINIQINKWTFPMKRDNIWKMLSSNSSFLSFYIQKTPLLLVRKRMTEILDTNQTILCRFKLVTNFIPKHSSYYNTMYIDTLYDIYSRKEM
jgi:hypothetical protein